MANTTYKKFKSESEKILARMRERATAFSEDEKQQENRLKRAKEDFLFFCTTYLPHYFDKPFDRAHFEWAKLTEITDTLVTIAAPPETGKTAMLEIALPLHHILFNKFRYGVQFCKDLDQSGDRVLFVRLELDENARIRQDFGDLKGRRWEQDDFITSTEIRYKALSLKKGIYGLTYRHWRPTFCILSDIEDDKTVASVKVTKKILHWLIRHVMPRFADGYKMIYAGNILHPKMALKVLLDKKNEDGGSVYPGGIWPLRKRSKSQFPHLWPQHRIEREEKAMGKTEFARVYDFIGLDDEKRFRSEWFINEPPEILIGIPLEKFGGIDPSPEPNAQLNNDQKAIVIVGVENGTIMHVIDAWIKVASVEEMISAGYDLHDRWQPRKFLLKGTKVEEMYRKLFDEGGKRRGRIPLPIQFENETTNKIIRLGNRLPSYFERGLLRLVEGNGHVWKIRDEAELFPDAKKDGLDALDMALEAAVKSYSTSNLVVAI
ncbi:MAG: hypothetical protein ACE5I1_04805 [bacterium]